MTSAFVTATGTDIGKTFVMRGLIRHFRALHQDVEALKPVVTGFSEAEIAGSDTGLILEALGRPVVLSECQRISPWRFEPPFSPDLAARLEGGNVDYEAMVRFCAEALAHRGRTVLIEGIGGIMVPLDERHLVLDWMMTLKLPLVVVTGSYLGTISHTLAALDVLRHRGLRVAALVVSESADSSVPLAETTRIIGHFAGGAPLIALPRQSADPAPIFAEIAACLEP
jgi:dethiobiotin synthetase